MRNQTEMKILCIDESKTDENKTHKKTENKTMKMKMNWHFNVSYISFNIISNNYIKRFYSSVKCANNVHHSMWYICNLIFFCISFYSVLCIKCNFVTVFIVAQILKIILFVLFCFFFPFFRNLFFFHSFHWIAMLYASLRYTFYTVVFISLYVYTHTKNTFSEPCNRNRY